MKIVFNNKGKGQKCEVPFTMVRQVHDELHALLNGSTKVPKKRRRRKLGRPPKKTVKA